VTQLAPRSDRSVQHGLERQHADDAHHIKLPAPMASTMRLGPWTLRHKAVTSSLIAASKVSHVDEAVAALGRFRRAAED
jgi:aryl-alcohol dehydrogenase-like predicted oxidoreductase